jgi:ABC-type transporter Mla subunit MlaD
LRNIGDINISRLSEGIERSLDAMTKVADSANLEKIGDQATALLAELRATNRDVNSLVNSPDLKSGIADASAAAGRARQLIDRAEKPIDRMLADLPQASESLSHMITRLDSVTNDLPETSAQLRQTLQRVNRLIADQQRELARTMENLRVVSENMKEITENSKRYPSQTLFGAPPPPSKVMQR